MTILENSEIEKKKKKKDMHAKEKTINTTNWLR